MNEIKIERSVTEVRIGNHGKPMAYVNTINEAIVKEALTKFNRGLFDVMGVKRYFNVLGKACVMDSLRLHGCGIYATLQYARDSADYPSEYMEQFFRKGCLWLGADIEFDTGKTISASILAYDMDTVNAMAVGEQMTSIDFRMLYVWDDYHKVRSVIYKAY